MRSEVSDELGPLRDSSSRPVAADDERPVCGVIPVAHPARHLVVVSTMPMTGLLGCRARGGRSQRAGGTKQDRPPRGVWCPVPVWCLTATQPLAPTSVRSLPVSSSAAPDRSVARAGNARRAAHRPRCHCPRRRLGPQRPGGPYRRRRATKHRQRQIRRCTRQTPPSVGVRRCAGQTPIYERTIQTEWSPSRQAWEKVTREFEHGVQTIEVHCDLHTGEVIFEKHSDINDQSDDGPGGPNRPRPPQDL